MNVALWAVEGADIVALPTPPHAKSVHELFDGLSLGVYSALRTFRHREFLALDEHLERTDRSMELLGWSERLDRTALRRAIDAAATRSPHADSTVRFDVLAEPAAAFGSQSRTLIATSAFHPVPEDFLRTGVRVALERKLARPRPLIKTAAFVVERRPYPRLTREEYEHVLVGAGGELLEATSANFYGVERGCVVTVKDGVLAGITRRIVVDLATEAKIEVEWRAPRVLELARLDEAFLTSSTRGVVPVVGVGDVRIGSGAPGPITALLRRAYDERAPRLARPAV